ncbi:hypothetical protein [Skermanella stibiiresistens]|nr:hypothetical protein [Skermanella stibiiresistens]
MNGMWFFAYVVMPIVVVALGYAAYRWDGLDHDDPADKHPGSAE